MVDIVKDQRHSIVRGLIEADEMEALGAILKKMPSVETAELLKNLSGEQILKLLPDFADEDLGDIASNMEMEQLLELFDIADRRLFARIFTNMSSDIRADLYQELDKDQQLELLPFLDKRTRENVIFLSSFPEETAGSIMITDFATVRADMTVNRAIEKIRQDAPSKKMIYYVYVVDENMKLRGFVTLKDIIMAEPDTPVGDILHSDFVWADVKEDRESVAQKIEKYDMVAIPVLNAHRQLAGIVRHDEAIDVIRAEHTEDLEKFMGIVHAPEDLNYVETGVFGHFRKRVVWLSSLAVIGIISGMIIHRYEEAMTSLIILALYMPMIADTGGNAGSQAATMVIRAIALGQITARSWLKILFKEARIAFLLSLVLGVIAFGKILFLSWETDVPPEYNLLFIAFAISLALSLQVITSTVLGAGLPLLVKRLGGDPAVAASPAITTLVDITGLLIYFGVATLFFF
ncbi:MAG: magnesium transporter [Marinilabiliales bacterium]|nr:MAG: magnesium transporter [Marinilabiliales bacterium]